MPTIQRIILVNDSRLLREMLHVVMYKADHLQVVREVDDHEELPSAIEHLEAEWLVMSLSVKEGIPDWVDHYIRIHPSMRFLDWSLGSCFILDIISSCHLEICMPFDRQELRISVVNPQSGAEIFQLRFRY